MFSSFDKQPVCIKIPRLDHFDPRLVFESCTLYTSRCEEIIIDVVRFESVEMMPDYELGKIIYRFRCSLGDHVDGCRRAHQL